MAMFLTKTLTFSGLPRPFLHVATNPWQLAELSAGSAHCPSGPGRLAATVDQGIAIERQVQGLADLEKWQGGERS